MILTPYLLKGLPIFAGCLKIKNQSHTFHLVFLFLCILPPIHILLCPGCFLYSIAILSKNGPQIIQFAVWICLITSYLCPLYQGVQNRSFCVRWWKREPLRYKLVWLGFLCTLLPRDPPKDEEIWEREPTILLNLHSELDILMYAI